MAQLTVKRTNQYVNRFRGIDIYMDNKKLGGVLNNETQTFEVPAGQHDFFAQGDWVTSKRITLDFAGNSKRQLELGSPVKWTVYRLIYSIGFISLIIWKRFFPCDFINQNFVWLMLILLVLSLVVGDFLGKQKSAIYYLTIGRKEYIYLKEI